MRKAVTIIVLLITAQLVRAQQDSVKNLSPARFFSDSAEVSVFRFAAKNPLWISTLMPNRISRISLSQIREQGKLVAAQGSTQTNTTSLETEGAIRLNSVNLYGAFSYRKIFEDSTRFAAQTRNNTSAPYYFGSPANNHYERSVYDFKALASKDFLQNKLTAGVAFDYHIADHFANNDPRGSIKEYQLRTKLILGYNFNKDIQLAAGINLGYGTEEVTIGYKNRIYFESTAYIRYVNHLINGYGAARPKTSDRKYVDNFNRFGYYGSFKMSNTALGSFYLDAEHSLERQGYNFRRDSGIEKLSSYDLSKLTLDLIWFKRFETGTLSATVSYLDWNGEDFNREVLAKNYVYTRNDFDLKLTYTLPDNKVTYNYTLNASRFLEERLDGINGNQSYYNNILLGGNFGLQYQLRSKQAIGFDIGIHYIDNLDNKFAVNQMASDLFTDEVIVHDYLYQTASKLGASFSASYIFPFIKLMNAAVRFNTVYTDLQSVNSLDRRMVSIPGNDRFYANLSFNLYF